MTVETKTELVTPAKAEKWLNANHSNRHLRSGVVERYAQDMRTDNWTNCTAAIAFYEDGDIADGQHRLWAIVESGRSILFIIMRGLDRKDGLNIDTNLTRNLVDAGRISGLDTGLSHTLISTCRAIELGNSVSTPISNAGKMELVNKHREAAVFAMQSGLVSKFIKNNVTLAAVARAWYAGVDPDKLCRFAKVMNAGFAEGQHESAAIAMRNYLLTKGTAGSHRSSWRDTFLKVQNAISYFVRGKPLLVIKGVGEEAYPLKTVRTGRVKKAEKAA